MKLSVLLTTLLLSSTPALAEDFIYLKCKTTTNNIVFDWTETERLNHWVSNAEILYKINTKNEELFVSSNPEVVISMSSSILDLLVGRSRFQMEECLVKVLGICNMTSRRGRWSHVSFR